MTLISMPSSPAFAQSDWGIKRKTVISESPFTGAQQVQKYDKAQWYCTLSLPPMSRAQAGNWQAFFLTCEGRANTFLLGDPDAKSLIGNATTAVVVVSGEIGTNYAVLNIGSGKTMKAGSYIQFHTAGFSKLHMLLEDVTQVASFVVCAINPPLKSSISTSSVVRLVNTQAVFRMDSNDLSWSADNLSRFGITFSCSEVP